MMRSSYPYSSFNTWCTYYTTAVHINKWWNLSRACARLVHLESGIDTNMIALKTTLYVSHFLSIRIQLGGTERGVGAITSTRQIGEHGHRKIARARKPVVHHDGRVGIGPGALVDQAARAQGEGLRRAIHTKTSST